mmetsp:Transcript_21172/g.38334  ORF Transcript_21172/g.38334 Transcript_21172/m.38334 type:complete len:229 (-) Transcript_21172:358-1044(-)
MKRHAALATGNDSLDRSTSQDVSNESFLSISPRATASENTLSTRFLLVFPMAVSSVAITLVNVAVSGDTSLLLGSHISSHMSNTSTGLFAVIPALINALYATMSGRILSFFISLNNSNAGSHCLELAQAVIADVYATLLGLIPSPFIALIRFTASCHCPAAPQVLMADEKVNESRRTPSFSMHFMRSSAFCQSKSVSASPELVRAPFDRAAIAELYVIVFIFKSIALI